ncbi:pyridoxal phosphate-dependent transferase [Amanita rubescens]|nr:pyridoxal phosphate-dependent transferase [Amanita rubescens]
MPSGNKFGLSGTDLLHGDDQSTAAGSEIAPSISVTTTFRSAQGLSLTDGKIDLRNPPLHVYSRYTQQISTRAEKILSRINHGHAITYASGLAACYSALAFFQPKRVAIKEGYHGCHQNDEYKPGDLCWLETPLNPTGESRNIQHYAERIHKVGGKLLIDATFGPPPLQYPFKWGADCIMHSGSKYFGGHSDLLCGILVVKTEEEWYGLHHNRTYMGTMMGSLEAWLLLRSLRTLHLRVPRQSATATALANWLNQISNTPKGLSYDGVPGGIITKVWHSSLQGRDASGFEPSKQMEGGWNATFSIMLNTPELASKLPYLLHNFIPATSLGGVESLMEYRRQSDPHADPKLLRLSIGVEELEDLKSDLRQGLQQLAQAKAKL